MSQSLTVSFGLRYQWQNHIHDGLNFAPRFGLAWSPFKSRKTTIRTGGGAFFSNLTGNLYGNTLRFNGETQESIIIRNAVFPDPFAGNPIISSQQTLVRTLDSISSRHT
jgi:hypothetical protein